MLSWYEKAYLEIEQDYDDGNIDYVEYMRQMRELRDEHDDYLNENRQDMY